MGEGRGGMPDGLAIKLLYYLYEQWAEPGPCDGIMFFIYFPVLVILGAMAGLVAAS